MELDRISALAHLARVKLTDDEKKQFGEQLDSVLKYIAQIRTLDLPEDAPQMAHAADLVNAWREDKLSGCTDEEREYLLKAFPKTKGNMNVVPGVFEERNE